METNNKVDPEVVLQKWRTRILNGFLVVAAGIASFMTLATFFDARTSPDLWPAVALYVVLTLVVAGLAFFRGIEYPIRAWSILIICFLAGLATMATFGLGSAGRLYMLAVPIIALILLGERPGIALTGISILTIVTFSVLAGLGLIDQFLVRDRNSLLLADWLAEFADTFGLLAVVMVLLILFYRFQARTIARVRSTHAELIQAQELLEEQNATLEQKVQERTAELQASNHSLEQRNAALGILNSVSEAMTKTLDVKTLMHLVGDKIRGIFDVDSSMIMLLDQQTGMIHVPYEYDRNEGGYIDYVEPFPLGTGLSSKVIMSGQPLIANTLEEEIANGAYFPPEIIARGKGAHGESWLGVPIMSSDQVLGLIALADNRPRMFNQNHMRLLQTLSSNLGAAIENAHLFHAEQDRIAELLVINNVQKALASKLDVQAIYELIGEQAQEVFNVEVVDIVAYDPDANLISMPYSYEKGDRSVISPRPPYGFRLQVINSREPLLINRDFDRLSMECGNPILTGAPPKSALFVPLLVEDQVRYIVSIQDLEKENSFKESDVRILQTLASSMSIALENARLFDETQRLLEETGRAKETAETLRLANLELTQNLDLNAICEKLLTLLSQVAPYDSASIFLLESRSRVVVQATRGYDAWMKDSAPARNVSFEIEPGTVMYHVANGRSYLIDDTRQEQEWVRIPGEDYILSWLGVPMMIGDDIIGVISLDKNQAGFFNQEMVQLATSLGTQAAFAIQNASLYRTQEIARAQAETLTAVSQALSRTLNLQELFDLILTELAKVVPYDSCSVQQLQDEYSVIVGGRGFPDLDGLLGMRFRTTDPGDLSALVYQTRQPHIEADVSAHFAHFKDLEEAAGLIHGWLGVPLIFGDRVIGMLALDKREKGFFTPEHARMAMAFAAQAAIAIENARFLETERAAREQAERQALENARLFSETQRLLKETEQRNAELAVINSVQAGLVARLDMQGIYELIGEKIREIFDVHEVDIATYDRSTGLLTDCYSYEKGDRTVIPGPVSTYGFRKYAIETRQPLLVNRNVEEISLEYGNPVLSGERPKSCVFVPMIAGQEVTGVISLQNMDRENAFHESDVRLLQTLTNSMSVTLENARLFDETQRLLRETEQRNRELSIINNIQQGLASKLEFQAIIDLFGDELSRIYPPQERIANNYSVYIALYDPLTQVITFPYLIDGAGERFVEAPTHLGPGLTSSIIRSGKPLVLKTAEEQIDHGVINFTQVSQAIGSQSWLGVPIRSGKQVIGVISMQDKRPNLFTESDIRILNTLAASLAVALENARLFSEVQQRAAELSIINSVQAGLASNLDMQAIYELVGEKIRETFNAQVVTIATYDRQTQIMQGRYYFEDGERRPAISLPAFGFRKYVVEHCLPLMINEDMSRWMKMYSNPILSGAQPKSAIFIPMVVGNEAVGVISLQNNEKENAYSQSDLYLLTTLVNSMSVALENARLFAETQRLLKETEQRAAELATVNTVSSAITGELDLSALIQLVGEQIRSIFKTDIAYVALLDKETHIIDFPYLYGQHLEPMQFGEGLTSRVIQSGTPLLINEDLQRQREQMGAAQMGRQALSYLGVPIFAGGEAIGVVSVQSTTQEGIFTDDDLHLLSTIAANVGIALQNARLFDEIRRQEQLARESAEKLRLIFENAFDGIDVYEEIPSTGQRILVECNDRYCELAGRSREELMSVENTSIFQRAILNPWDETGREAILKGEAFGGVFSWIRPDGRENIIEYNAAPTRVGERYFTIGLDRDVTERVHYEKELEKARAEAEQANQAKSAFLANMSHELRTPLNAIIGFTRIVRRKAEGVLPDKQTENLDKVLTSAEHLLNLINTVLDIAKIEAGRMDVLAANFRIAALVDLCANTAQPLLKPSVLLEKEVEESLTYVYSDQDKIRQIVLNLLSNAAKFTHEGRIVLSARQQGDNLRIAVRDTGIGISAEALPRIFKEFQQADNTTTRQYGGTGLGLSISRNLAHLLGGDLTVESELGVGSTFTLVVPIHYESRLAASQPDREPFSQAPGGTAPVQETAAPPEPGLLKKRVLVIDDDPDAVYLLQENLNPQEYEILGARNGPDGLEMARRQQPHAILLDIVMPGKDGWHVLHDLKANPVTAHIPVVFLTIVDKKALGLQLGAAAYLLKPLDAAEVRGTLDRVINGTVRPKHILVVDDDPNVADMLRQFLPESDFQLESAPDGLAGLEAIAAHLPDILLLDILMPRLDGFGVIERLRADPGTSGLPIVVLSAKDLTAEDSARLRETVALVMKKQGFEGTKLVDEINHILGVSQPVKNTLG